MTELRIKIDAGYGTVIAESDDQRICARVLSMILDAQAEAAEALTPEQTAINVLREEMEQLRTDLSMAKYSRDNIQKKLDKAKEFVPEGTEL